MKKVRLTFKPLTAAELENVRTACAALQNIGIAIHPHTRKGTGRYSSGFWFHTWTIPENNFFRIGHDPFNNEVNCICFLEISLDDMFEIEGYLWKANVDFGTGTVMGQPARRDWWIEDGSPYVEVVK